MNCKELCATKTKQEFHWTRLLLRHRDWRTLAYVPWLPYNQWQIIYIVARWFLFLYFMGWLIATGFYWSDPVFFAYLTNWSIVVWTLYLLIAAFSCTLKYTFHMYHIAKGKVDDTKTDPHDPESTTDSDDDDIYISWRTDSVAWYQKIQWIFYNMASAIEIAVAILYWALLYDPTVPVSGENINTHLTPAIVAVIEVWVVGIVLNIYHVYMIILLGTIYGIFTVIYWGAGGLGWQNTPYIYFFLDYRNNPGLAVGILVGCIFLFFPAMYFILYGMSLLRRWLVGVFRQKVYKGQQ